MGKYNSSTYRVTPLMKHIEGNLDRINKFLSLLGLKVDSLPTDYFYGKDEKLLKPTKEHLIALVEYIFKRDNSKITTTNKNREVLYHASKEERAKKKDEAVKLINKRYNLLPPTTRAWYIFEGFTHPDIFVEGEDYILIGEGKWTEDHITVETTHLKTSNKEYRNQMIRHIQGAINYSNKPVYAFYLVDEKCGYLNDLTKESFKEQLDKETIKLSNIDKKKVLDAFKGYTTWQDIKKAFPDLEFLEKKNIK